MPCSRKYSATAVAASADFKRNSGGASEVAHTHTARAAALVVELGLEKVAHLAAALADQADDDDVGLGVARDLPEQRRLAEARPGEEADALPFADGGERVDGAHAERQRAR